MKTEDGFSVYSNSEYWIVYFNNHSCDIDTSNERELFKPFRTIIHCEVKSINTFGIKLFKLKNNATKWCLKNRTID